MNDLISFLNEEIEHENLARQRIAAKAGLHSEGSYQWFKGKVDPTLTNFQNFAAAMGYDLVLIPRENVDLEPLRKRKRGPKEL